MGVLTILTVCLALYGLRLRPLKAGINKDYMTQTYTESVKGIFVLTVLTGHLSQYVELGSSVLDLPYLFVDDWIAQCIVAPFLFCSGYGIFCSFMTKGREAYIKAMPKRRILPTLLHFDVAILLFLIMNLALGIRYSAKEYITALVGWNSVGNSTWYIFATLCLYLVSYVSGLIACRLKESKQSGVFVLLILIGTLLYILVLSQFKQEVYYNTVLCFPVGAAFGLAKDKIDRAMEKLGVWIAAILVLAAAYLACILWMPSYYFRAPVFALLVFVATMRIQIRNVVLDWLGKHIFEIYILQRIPQIIFSHFGFNSNQYVFILLCVPVTILSTFGFRKLIDWMDVKLGLKKLTKAVNG